MITRKENLLIRPFQHKKYIEHRNKVSCALPKIDDVTPIRRDHVSFKHKKMQVEAERHAQIERDNFILLKHLNDIMKTKRVDNYWLYDQPKFLHRIKLFDKRPSSFTFIKESTEITEKSTSISINKRCIACNPEIFIKKKVIPEERVPYEYKPIREFNKTNKKPSWNEEQESFKKNFTNTKNFVNNRQDFQNKNKQELKIINTESKIQPRIRTATNNYKILINRKTEHPLTVIIKFPPTVQVMLNAGLDENR